MDSDYPFGIFKLFLLAHHVSFCHGSASVVLISANENTLWTLAAMLDFKSAPKTAVSEKKI
jgi:hypothetical protein